jgi:hypothetical protein
VGYGPWALDRDGGCGGDSGPSVSRQGEATEDECCRDPYCEGDHGAAETALVAVTRETVTEGQANSRAPACHGRAASPCGSHLGRSVPVSAANRRPKDGGTVQWLGRCAANASGRSVVNQFEAGGAYWSIIPLSR